MSAAVSNVEFVARVEHTLTPVATRAAAELREGAQEAMRFQFNLFLLRTAVRIMLGMLKIALPFVLFQLIRNFLSGAQRGRLAGAVHVR
jgi:hypothetical protein